jgi:hypothetical protein
MPRQAPGRREDISLRLSFPRPPGGSVCERPYAGSPTSTGVGEILAVPHLLIMASRATLFAAARTLVFFVKRYLKRIGNVRRRYIYH